MISKKNVKIEELSSDDWIEFKIYPSRECYCWGDPIPTMKARFVDFNSSQNTLTYQQIFQDPVFALGSKEQIDMKRVGNLVKLSFHYTGPG